ncbi:hypothetical protein LPJ63_003018 [Coemansia sp. RSA 2711]|nr:hypothetical protein LPJ63_003018 [Coemansia sp. RSA 2711]
MNNADLDSSAGNQARRASMPIIQPDRTLAASAGYWQPALAAAQLQIQQQLMSIQIQPPVPTYGWEGLLTEPSFQPPMSSQMAYPVIGFGNALQLGEISPSQSERSAPLTTIIECSETPQASGSGKSSKRPRKTDSNSADTAKLRKVVKTQYQCDQCQKYFTRPSSLATHKLTHTGEKPHSCTFQGCGKCFSVMSNLRRHVKLHENPQPRGRRRSQYRHYRPAGAVPVPSMPLYPGPPNFHSLVPTDPFTPGPPMDMPFGYRRASMPVMPAEFQSLFAQNQIPTPPSSSPSTLSSASSPMTEIMPVVPFNFLLPQ